MRSGNFRSPSMTRAAVETGNALCQPRGPFDVTAVPAPCDRENAFPFQVLLRCKDGPFGPGAWVRFAASLPLRTSQAGLAMAYPPWQRRSSLHRFYDGECMNIGDDNLAG